MNRTFSHLEIKVLEEMYLKQTELLKGKIKAGAPFKAILKQENKTIQLAIEIHHKQCSNTVLQKNCVEAIPVLT